MTTNRSVAFPHTGTIRITVTRANGETVSHDYRIQVWHLPHRYRSIELRRTDAEDVLYRITIWLHPTNQRCSEWACSCPDAKYRGSCKHVLGIKAGLRQVGCKV